MLDLRPDQGPDLNMDETIQGRRQTSMTLNLGLDLKEGPGEDSPGKPGDFGTEAGPGGRTCRRMSGAGGDRTS